MQSLLHLFFLFTGCVSYKFLVYSPLYASSHANFIGRVADTLANAGHDVTVVLPIIDSMLTNKTFVRSNARQIKVPMDPRMEPVMEEIRHVVAGFWENDLGPLSLVQTGKKFAVLHQYACEAVLSNKTLLEELKTEKFDVGIAEPISIVLFRELGINSTIAALSFVQNEYVSWAIGEPLALSYVPHPMSKDGEKMTFIGRVKNVVHMALAPVFFKWTLSIEIDGLERLMRRSYDLNDLIGSIALVFTNENPFLNYPRPLLHKTVPIGGITMEYDKGDGLGEKWDKVLSERNFTVYISFGTMMNSIHMPREMKKSIVQASSQFSNLTFIWKYEKPEELAEEAAVPANLYLSSWLPQLAILADPRLSFMITHGGLGSITELAYFGKPAIMVPGFGDQIRNCEMLRRHGVGLVLSKSDLYDTDLLVKAMGTMLSTKEFTENAARFGQMLQEQPVSAQDLVIKHAEFVAKFGSLPMLQPHGRHLNVLQYYLLDVIVAIFSITTVMLFSLFCCIRFIARKWCGTVKYQKLE